jgi:hypothetical protein
LAMALPIPLAPPVITMILSLISIIFCEFAAGGARVTQLLFVAQRRLIRSNGLLIFAVLPGDYSR